MATVLAILVCATFAIFLPPLWRVLTNYRKLKSIPGPLLAACTDYWIQAQLRSKKGWENVTRELHGTYGPIVRYGPKRISFADPACVPILFRTKHPLEKSDAYSAFTGFKDGKEVVSLVSLRPETRHAAIKKPLSSIFSPSASKEFEHHVDHSLMTLVKALRKESTVDLVHLLGQYSFDVLCKIAFSENLRFMETMQDIGGIRATVTKRFEQGLFWAFMPGLDRWINRNPLWLKLSQPTNPLAALAVSKLQARKAAHPSPQRDLLQKYIEASEQNPDSIPSDVVVGLTMSTIAAGAATTSNTLSIFFYHMARNPDKLRKLEKELDDALAAGIMSLSPRLDEVDPLRYLDASIKEAMRIHTILNFPLEKVAPQGGIEVAGTFVPEGTIITPSSFLIHESVAVYGEDATSFNPDRWLDASDAQKQAMERSFLGFSAGRRVCLGRYIALLEMKKTIPTVLLRFRMSLVEPDREINYGHNLIVIPDGIVVNVEPRAGRTLAS